MGLSLWITAKRNKNKNRKIKETEGWGSSERLKDIHVFKGNIAVGWTTESLSLSVSLSLSLCTQASAGVSAMENTHLWITSPGLFSPIWPTVCQGVRLGGWSLNTSSLWEGRVPEGEVTAAAAAAVVVFVYSFFAFTFTFTSSGGAPHPDAPSGGSERGLSCDTFARLTGHGDRKTDRRKER